MRGAQAGVRVRQLLLEATEAVLRATQAVLSSFLVSGIAFVAVWSGARLNTRFIVV